MEMRGVRLGQARTAVMRAWRLALASAAPCRRFRTYSIIKSSQSFKLPLVWGRFMMTYHCLEQVYERH